MIHLMAALTMLLSRGQVFKDFRTAMDLVTRVEEAERKLAGR